MAASEHNRIRVLHLGSPTGLYGAERWILALVKHLPTDQVDSWVGVIRDAPELEAPLCREASRIGIPTQQFQAHGKLSLRAIGQIRDFVRQSQIEIIHTHGYKTDIIGRIAVTGTTCKSLITPHGWNIDGDPKLKIYEALDRICFRFADAVAPLSSRMNAELRRLPGVTPKLHLIANGVDLSDLAAADEPAEPLRQWHCEGRLIIGYIGRLIALKRVDTLIHAFHRLPLERKHLCIVGEGPLRDQLQRLAADLGEAARITFFGYRDDRVALLKGFDVFVLPSETEGTPRCLMEAMASGIPVIASDIAGCRELVDGETTGLLFEPGNSDALLERVVYLLQNPELRAKLAREACRRVRASFSAEAMALSYLALYRRLVARAEALRRVAEVR